MYIYIYPLILYISFLFYTTCFSLNFYPKTVYLIQMTGTPWHPTWFAEKCVNFMQIHFHDSGYSCKTMRKMNSLEKKHNLFSRATRNTSLQQTVYGSHGPTAWNISTLVQKKIAKITTENSRGNHAFTFERSNGPALLSN